MKFFTDKYRSTLSKLPVFIYGPAAVVAAVDGGLTLATCLLVGGGIAAATTGLGIKIDATRKKTSEFKTKTGQMLSGPIWALQAHESIQSDLINTFNAISKKPESKRNEKQKDKLLKKADELENYLTVIDRDKNPIDEPVLYVTQKEYSSELEAQRKAITAKGDKFTPRVQPFEL